ncbi:hypothetical protein CRYUN_Cryun23aG0033500 [Craigia yunnanensis]
MARASTNNTNHGSSFGWLPPPMGILKLNVDAAYSSYSNIASCGLVVRNSAGSPCLCAVKKTGNIVYVLQAKLQAILFGLKIAWENSYISIVVESDSLLAIREINKKQDSFCEWGGLISYIKDLSLNF